MNLAMLRIYSTTYNTIPKVSTIKMVGSFGVRNRRVHWNSLFKDGTFQKQVRSGVGPRVRTQARSSEMARAEAEAKFGDALRASKRELVKAGRELEAMKQDVELRLKRQEVESRKDERTLSAGYKRQLEQMLDDNRQDMQALREDVEEKNRDTRKCVRELRQEISSLMEQVGREKEGQADLAKHLLQEQKKRTVLMGTVDAWKDKHVNLDKITIDKDDRIKVMKRDLAETVREKQTLVKRGERDDLSNRLEIERLLPEWNISQCSLGIDRNNLFLKTTLNLVVLNSLGVHVEPITFGSTSIINIHAYE
jgi:hypothetical protein